MKFKVGDRVLVYGTTWDKRELTCEKATVERIDDKGVVYVRMDVYHNVYWYHPKQLRRLKPKKKKFKCGCPILFDESPASWVKECLEHKKPEPLESDIWVVYFKDQHARVFGFDPSKKYYQDASVMSIARYTRAKDEDSKKRRAEWREKAFKEYAEVNGEKSE